MKRIPKSFQLGGHNFAVRYVDEEGMLAKSNGVPAYGLFVPDELTIYLLQGSRKLKKSVVIQTFWHEFFHAMFWVANHQWLNEKLVDQCGHLVHQFFATAEF